MAKCLRCNVTINDETEKCPLCGGLLYRDGGKGENKYPKARRQGRMTVAKGFIFAVLVLVSLVFSRLLLRLILFLLGLGILLLVAVIPAVLLLRSLILLVLRYILRSVLHCARPVRAVISARFMLPLSATTPAAFAAKRRRGIRLICVIVLSFLVLEILLFFHKSYLLIKNYLSLKNNVFAFSKTCFCISSTAITFN